MIYLDDEVYFFQNPRDLEVWNPPRKDLFFWGGEWVEWDVWHIYLYIYTANGSLHPSPLQGL